MARQSSSLRCAVETPWASGDVQRDQGIGHDGPPWVGAYLIQMAWRRLRHQPDSPLSKWLERRTVGAKGRIGKVMIISLARRLLIALWRFFGSVTTEARAGAETIRPANEQLKHSPRCIEPARPKRWNGVLPTTTLWQTLGLNPLACSPILVPPPA